MRLNLSEEVSRHFMTKKELQLRDELVKLLRARRHAKYAARLELFDLNVVPLSVDADFTAAISFDEGVVYISEGFVNGDRATFEQLDMVLRHELAHNLLMHQIRMLHKLGEKSYMHIRFSSLLHRLWNIIEDDEISNTRYTQADKLLARNLLINGQVIKGLVTEDHRQNWVNLSVEQMYEELLKESAEIQQEVQKGSYAAATGFMGDFIKSEIAKTRIYTDTQSPSKIKRPLKNFLNGKAFKKYPQHLKDIALGVAAGFPEDFNGVKDAAEAALTDIAQSDPLTLFELKCPANGEVVELHTPEEKWFVVQILKLICGNISFDPDKFEQKKHTKKYKKQYNKTILAFDKDAFSNEELAAILSELREIGISVKPTEEEPDESDANEEDEEPEIEDEVKVGDAGKLTGGHNQ